MCRWISLERRRLLLGPTAGAPLLQDQLKQCALLLFQLPIAHLNQLEGDEHACSHLLAVTTSSLPLHHTQTGPSSCCLLYRKQPTATNQNNRPCDCTRKFRIKKRLVVLGEKAVTRTQGSTTPWEDHSITHGPLGFRSPGC